MERLAFGSSPPNSTAMNYYRHYADQLCLDSGKSRITERQVCSQKLLPMRRALNG